MNTKDFYPTNFNPSDWLKSENKASSAAAPSSSGVASPTSREDDATRVKALIEALQASHVDLTASYDNWLHVGFALANTFGLGCLYGTGDQQRLGRYLRDGGRRVEPGPLERLWQSLYGACARLFVMSASR